MLEGIAMSERLPYFKWGIIFGYSQDSNRGIDIEMSTRKSNTITERLGINYVRSVVESQNSMFKEIDLRNDYGHDAFIHLVDGEKVLAKEIAAQIKSGKSYCTETTCKIPATYNHLLFWSRHDLTTLGIVYDPDISEAYWVDLKEEAKALVLGRREKGATIEFPKLLWNSFNEQMFSEFLLPTLQGEAPRISLSTAILWANSTDYDTHDIGVRTLAVRYKNEMQTWDTFVEMFHERHLADVTPNLCLSFAKMMGHDDIGYYTGQIEDQIVNKIRPIVRKFDVTSVAKFLHHVDDGFDRPSMGYSLLPVFASIEDGLKIYEILSQATLLPEHVRQNAAMLLEIYRYDPEWWSLWKR